MQIFKYYPETQLKPYIDSILITNSNGDFTNDLLPGTAPVLVFRLKGTIYINAVKIPDSGITGMSRVTREVRYTTQSGALLVIFKEGGAAAFTDIPLHEFSGSTVDLTYVFSAAKIRKVQDSLEKCINDKERISEIERFLTDHLTTDRRDKTIDSAVEAIKAHNGIFRINELASDFNINIDSFEKRFRANVGTSPKQYSSIVRMLSVINSYEPGSSLTEVSLEKGFFDQAHFSREFKAFTGKSPTVFFRNLPKKW